VKLVEKNSGNIDFTVPTQTATIKVSEYGKEQEKVIVYVSKGSRTTDRTKWKQVKEVPASAAREYEIAVSGSEIAAAMGAPIAPGDLYTLYNSCITKDGGRFDFGNINGEVAGNPNYNMALTWSAAIVCAFTGNMAGNYEVLRDDWVDWSPGSIVPVTDGPAANQVNISQVWPNPAFGSVVGSGLFIKVDPATGTASVEPNLTWGNYGSYTTVNNGPGSGYVFSCTGDIIMTIRINAPPFGDQGNFGLILKKR
jgi:hypothetical protein